MAPYLEGALRTTFHFAFGAKIVPQLAPRLRPRYLVLPIECLVIETFDTLLRTTGLRQA